MKGKETNVKISSTFQYIQLLNGIFGLTDTEIEVLAAFIDQHKLVRKAGLKLNPFFTEMKKKVAEKLGRDDFNTLNNYIKRMHDKRAIKKIDDGYVIHPILVPNNDKSIIFHLKWIKKT